MKTFKDMKTFKGKSYEDIIALQTDVLANQRNRDIVKNETPFKELTEEELENIILYWAFIFADELYIRRESAERNDIIRKSCEELNKLFKEAEKQRQEALKNVISNNKKLEIKYEQQAKQNK